MENVKAQNENENQKESGRKTVFVRNLPYTATDKELEDIFSEYGPIKRCFVVKDKDKGQLCRGFGYVTFVMQEDASKALSATVQMNNRKVKLTVAEKKPRQRDNYKRKSNDTNDEEHVEAPKEVIEPAKKVVKAKEKAPEIKQNVDEQKRTIILTGLDDKTATKSKLKKLCSKQGKVEKIQYPVEGRSKDVAFITFKSIKTAVRAFQKLNGTTFNENVINSCLLNKEGKQPVSKLLDKSQLIVRNLSFKCAENDLKEAFEKFGKVLKVELPIKVNTKGKKKFLGFGFVQFSCPKDATKALKALNKSELLARPMIIDWAVPKDQYDKEKGKEEHSNSKDTKEETGKEKPGKKSTKEKHTKERDLLAEEDEDDDDDDDGIEDESTDGGENSEESEYEEEAATNEKKNESRGASSDEEDDEEDDYEDDSEEDDEEDDEDFARKEQEKKERLRIQAKDAKEGRTIFMRNLPFEISDEEVFETFSKFGEIEYCKIVFDPETGHSRGTGFVKYKETEAAEMAVSQSEDGIGDQGISIGGRRLVVMKAVTKGKVKEIEKQKKESKKDPKDKRNLYLANEGVIFPNSEAAKEISEGDMKKREKAWAEKKTKLKNQNYFISKTRLCFRNLPLTVGEKELKDSLRPFGQPGGKILRTLVMRNKERLDKTGKGRSLGFAFVEFNSHEHALAVLRSANNNAEMFGEDRRPIVEFSVENQIALNLQKKRLDRQKQKLETTEKEAEGGTKAKGSKENRWGKDKRKRKGEGEADVGHEKGKKPRRSEDAGLANDGPKNKSNKHQKKSQELIVGQRSGVNENARKINISADKVEGDRKRTLNKSGMNSERDAKAKQPKKKVVKDSEEEKFNLLVNKYKQKLFGERSSEKKAIGKRWFE